MHWSTWVIVPLIGAGIGYATNWLAIKMLFHPRKRRFGMQGLLPRRQRELAERVADVVAQDVIHVDDLLDSFDGIDLREELTGMLDTVMQRKVGELQKIPLIGAMVTAERVAGIRDGILEEILRHQDEIREKLKNKAAEHIDIQKLATEKIAAFDLERLEDVVHRVAKQEFRAIEIWGAVLGAVIGGVQLLIIYVTQNL